MNKDNQNDAEPQIENGAADHEAFAAVADAINAAIANGQVEIIGDEIENADF